MTTLSTAPDAVEPEPAVATVASAAVALRAGELTSSALTRMLLTRIDAENERLGAFVTVCAEPALAAAAAADAELAAGVDRGPLHGIPLAIKDIIATHDAPTTANSRVLRPEWGRGVDAPAVARLREHGAVIIGKATTSEFATGVPDVEKGYLVPRNPWNVAHTPAGSSSGTGVAVAAGLALGGLGTDTGGSVRGPAAANGITGLKTTFGRVPKNGVVALADTLDSVGPMARSALDCALLLAAVAGHHPGDPYAADEPVPDYPDLVAGGDVEGLRVGVPTSYFFDRPELDEEVRDAVLVAVDVLAGAGARVVPVEVPAPAEAKAAANVIGGAEALARHHADLTRSWLDYGRNTRTNLARGALFSAADYVQAQRFRTWFRSRLQELFTQVDVLVTPTAISPAGRIDAVPMFRDYVVAGFTSQWNLAGLPAVAAPCGFGATGLPMSLQIVGRPFDEATVLTACHAYQQRTDWHVRPVVAR